MSVLLYDYWRSSASYRVRIALNLKQIDYATHTVDLLKQDHRSADYLAINAQGLVPALAIDGQLLTQSMAILEYLEETRPTPPLLPNDAAGRVRVRQICQVIAMEIHPLCNISVATHAGQLAGTDSGHIDWMRHYMTRGFDALEPLLDDAQTGRFCHGDHPTFADCLLVPQLYNARRWDLDLSRYPQLVRCGDNAAALDEFKAAAPEAVHKG